MAKAQGKKAAAAGKGAAKKVVAQVKSAAGAAKNKVAPKKQAPPPKPAAKKAAPPPAKVAAKKPAAKAPAKKTAPAAKVKAAAKVVKKVVAKVTKPLAAAAKPIAKAAKPAAKAAVKAVKAAVKPAAKVAAKPAAKVAAKPASKAAAKPAPKAPEKAPAKPAAKLTPKAVPPPPARTAPVATPPPPSAAARPAAPVAEEKKRGRRARPRVHSSGAPAAAWLSTEKPRPASFIPAPARAEAPSAVAAPPASSDRLIRPDDVDHPAVRTVPVRIDVEQGAGRFYVIAYPLEASVRPGEGIEWDFRYLGGADFSVEEIVVEFEKPSPFAQTVFRTRKPGGARPHRQMSNGALPAAAGRRIQYTVRAMTPFRTELASTTVWLNVTT